MNPPAFAIDFGNKPQHRLVLCMRFTQKNVIQKSAASFTVWLAANDAHALCRCFRMLITHDILDQNAAAMGAKFIIDGNLVPASGTQ